MRNYLILFLISINSCTTIRKKPPLPFPPTLDWVFVDDEACLNEANVKALREYMVRLLRAVDD